MDWAAPSYSTLELREKPKAVNSAGPLFVSSMFDSVFLLLFSSFSSGLSGRYSMALSLPRGLLLAAPILYAKQWAQGQSQPREW